MGGGGHRRADRSSNLSNPRRPPQTAAYSVRALGPAGTAVANKPPEKAYAARSISVTVNLPSPQPKSFFFSPKKQTPRFSWHRTDFISNHGNSFCWAVTHPQRREIPPRITHQCWRGKRIKTTFLLKKNQRCWGSLTPPESDRKIHRNQEWNSWRCQRKLCRCRPLLDTSSGLVLRES